MSKSSFTTLFSAFLKLLTLHVYAYIYIYIHTHTGMYKCMYEFFLLNPYTHCFNNFKF